MPRASERRSAASQRHADTLRFVLFETRPAGLTFVQLVRSSELTPSQARAGLACLRDIIAERSWPPLIWTKKDGYRFCTDTAELQAYELAIVREKLTEIRRFITAVAVGFGISVGTAHAYAAAVVDLLANRAPGLLRALREADPDHVLLDGTLAECDRVGDSRADYSHKHRRHGVNVQVVTDPAGRLLWISPALPGRAHDLTAARTHRIIRICERQGVPVLADRAYMGAGPWVTTPLRRPPGRDVTPTQQTVNRALSAARAPVERGVARLKSWRIFRRSRCSPNRMTSIAAAVLTLERQG